MSGIEIALRARTKAVSRSPHDPLIYAAWRYVTYCESQLSDDEHDEYRRRLLADDDGGRDE